MRGHVADTSDTIISFPNDSDPDPLDRVGQTVVNLLQRAADIAEDNYHHAVGDAQKLALQLQAAEDHIKELEAGIEHYKDRADRAESWLRQISLELEQRFVALTDHRHPVPAQPTGPVDYTPKRDSSVVNQAMLSQILELEKRFVASDRRSHSGSTQQNGPLDYAPRRGSSVVDQLRWSTAKSPRPAAARAS